MATAFPSIAVSQSSARSTANDISTIRFGNGYEQRTPVGINYKRDKWNISWDALDGTEKNTIVTFLQAISDGSYTTWTTPMDTVSKKFVLDGEWSITNRGGDIWSISCNLRQVFDI